MANDLGKTTAPFQRYIFHFLPGLLILVCIYIIFYNTNEIKSHFILIIKELAKILQFSSSELLGFTFLLLVLIFALGFVFLFGLIIDSARHMIEEIFLVAKWSEYSIIEKFKSAKGILMLE